MRETRGIYIWLCIAFTWIGIGASVFYIFNWNLAGMIMIESAFVALILGVFLPCVFILYPATAKAPRDKVPWYDQILAWASILGPALVFIFAQELTESLWPFRPPPVVMMFGILTWGLLIEAVRRTTGMPMAIIVTFFSLYPLFASHMPGFLFAKSYSLERLVGYQYLTSQGIFGVALFVFSRLIIGFMLFGAALDATGASRFLLDLAQGLLGKLRGGPALVSVVGSACMSSLSGSAMANVASTGCVTIPAMKKAEFPSHQAGAIEAVASNAGMLTPPIMGAVAFIMAGLLRVPYIYVATAAAIPMIIFYASLFVEVYTYAHKKGIASTPPNEIPSVKKVLFKGWFYLGAIVVLVYLLFWIRVEAWAAYYATMFLVLCAFIRKETRPNLKTLYNFTIGLGRTLAFLGAIMAAVGLVMGGLSLTGVDKSLASDLLNLARGNLYLLLIFGGIGSLILGTGMPMIPLYIFMALVFAPILTQMEIHPMSSHMFFLYWATLSCITPPICTTVFTACTISGSPPMKTAFASVKLAIVIYIIPFAFVLNPALLLNGPWPIVVWSTVTALIGGVVLAFAAQGYVLWFGNIRAGARTLLFAIGLLLFFSPLWGMIGIAAIGIGTVLAHFIFNRYAWCSAGINKFFKSEPEQVLSKLSGCE